MWYESRPGRIWGRLAASLTGSCATVHVGMALVAVGAGRLPLAMALLGMAVACAPCALGLWRAPDATGWGMTAVMAAVMLALHGPLMLFAGPVEHLHSAPGWTELAPPLTALQLAVAGTVVLARRRSPGGGGASGPGRQSPQQVRPRAPGSQAS